MIFIDALYFIIIHNIIYYKVDNVYDYVLYTE